MRRWTKNQSRRAKIYMLLAFDLGCNRLHRCDEFEYLIMQIWIPDIADS